MGSLLVALGAAGTGCADIAVGGDDGVTAHETGEADGVRATLGLSGADLRVTLRNGAGRDAHVSLSAFVHTPVANAKSDVGTVTVPAGQTVEHVITASELKGFDVPNSAWVRTELEYYYEYDDGVQYRRMTGLATRDGAALARDEAISTGRALADIPIGRTEVSTRALGSFKVCFTDQLAFNKANGFSNHGLSPDLSDASGNTPILPMPGQFFYAYYNGQIKGGGNVGTDGCASVARQTTGAETWVIQPIHYVNNAQTNILGLREDGSSPAQYKFTINVSAGGTVTVASGSSSVVSYPSGSEDSLMLSAIFLASNTLTRAKAIGVMAGAQLLTIMPTEPTVTSHYCEGVSLAQDCPSALTIRLAKTKVVNNVSTTDANDREVIAHETGHFIHHMNAIGLPLGDYDYSDADAAPLNPSESAACTVYRSASPTTGEGIHDFQSIEWQPAAHNEGIANFFAAVAYNKVVKGGACTLRGTNCEKPGMSLDSCTEGTSSALFHVTGVEMDWTKMLWDFVTDKGGDMNTFFAAERQITNEGGWPSDGHGNVYDTIQSHLNAINPDMKRKLYDSAGGNIWDGTPDFVCKSTTGIPVLNPDGTGYCCPLSCGTCGGAGCSGRPGGSNACCTGGIAAADKSCAPNVAPCLIRNASVIGGP